MPMSIIRESSGPRTNRCRAALLKCQKKPPGEISFPEASISINQSPGIIGTEEILDEEQVRASGAADNDNLGRSLMLIWKLNLGITDAEIWTEIGNIKEQ
jgi:hypothetical protein